MEWQSSRLKLDELAERLPQKTGQQPYTQISQCLSLNSKQDRWRPYNSFFFFLLLQKQSYKVIFLTVPYVYCILITVQTFCCSCLIMWTITSERGTPNCPSVLKLLLIGSLVVVMRKVMKWYQKWGFVAINLLCGFLEFQDWFVGRCGKVWSSRLEKSSDGIRQS